MSELIELTNKRKEFEVFRWVLRARAKNPTRHSLRCLQIQTDCICAMDGRRLHFVRGDFSKHKEYLYRVVKSTLKQIILVIDDEVGRFPKWEDMVPKHKKYFALSTYGSEFAFCWFEYSRLGIMLNPTYLKDACLKGSKCYYKDFDSPVLLTSKIDKYKTGAVIMHIEPPKFVHEVRV